jgi:hypothetical protein
MFRNVPERSGKEQPDQDVEILAHQCRIKMRTSMSLKSYDVGHGGRAGLELYRSSNPLTPALDPQAAIKRGAADVRVGPFPDIVSMP